MTQIRSFAAGFAAATVAGAVVVALGFAPSQSGTGKDKPSAPPVPKAPNGKVPSPKDPGRAAEIPVPPEMAAAMEFMTPGPEHAWLSEKAGTWKMAGKMWMGPGEPIENNGTTTFRMILGGRYLLEDVKSSFMNESFEAMGLTAFNRATKKFQLVWIDSMGTAISEGTATRSADGKTLNGSIDMLDPATGQMVTMRTVETHHNLDSFTFEMFGPSPAGSEMRVMELVYTRAK